MNNFREVTNSIKKIVLCFFFPLKKYIFFIKPEVQTANFILAVTSTHNYIKRFYIDSHGKNGLMWSDLFTLDKQSVIYEILSQTFQVVNKENIFKIDNMS